MYYNIAVRQVSDSAMAECTCRRKRMETRRFLSARNLCVIFKHSTTADYVECYGAHKVPARY